jgi:hypothetical protein
LLSNETPSTEEPTVATTISGRPITSPVAFRLAIPDYQRLQERAGLEGKTVAALVQEWVLEKLTEKPEELKR